MAAAGLMPRNTERTTRDFSVLISPLERQGILPQPVLRDISPEGFGLTMLDALRTGEKIRFQIMIPKSGSVTGVAEVKWCNPASYSSFSAGLRILEMGEDDSQRLASSLRKSIPAASANFFLLGAALSVILMMLSLTLNYDNAPEIVNSFFASLPEPPLSWPTMVNLVTAVVTLATILDYRLAKRSGESRVVK